jgi:hypothetical protein
MTAPGPLYHPHAARVVVGGGRLEPSPLLLAELRALDPRLGLRHLAGIDRFVVTQAWHANDPRRALLRSGEPDGVTHAPAEGEGPNDTDVLLVLPLQLPLGEVIGYVTTKLVSRTRTAKDDQEEMHVHNELQSERNAKPALDAGKNKMETIVANRLGPTAFQYGGSTATARNTDGATQPVER